jgi:hypothetical protein
MPNETERFQDFCKKYINRKVKEHFSDLGDERWQPDFNVDRHFTRWVCTHQDKDPLTLSVGRLLVYFFKIQGLLDAPIYSMPCTQLFNSVECLPQIIINFQESVQSARDNNRNKHPLTAQHYIRVRTDFSSESEVQRIARKVKEVFATPIFSFDKGRLKYTYLDRSKGYFFIVATPNEAEARNVVEKLLAINNDVPDWELLTESRSNKNFTSVQTMRVNGKQYKKPQRRPLGRVSFISAELHVDGLPGNIHLLDLSGRSRDVVLAN